MKILWPLIGLTIILMLLGRTKAETNTDTETDTDMEVLAEEYVELINSDEETANNTDTSKSPEDMELTFEDTRILKETDVSILGDNCRDGVCRDLVYDDAREVVFFEAKPQVRFTSGTTYVIKDPPKYDVLRFVDSKFVNFPLNLFYSLKIQELDMRNCSIKRLTWDNFLMADRLSILLLSLNHLREIKPMTFGNAEKLSFLFLDSNEIDTLHRESFKGLKQLYMLDLHDNRLESLPENLFAYLPALQQLNLAENRLQVIYDDTFASNPRLTTVNLQSNLLETLGEYVFQNQEFMDYVGLSHNRRLQSLVGNIRVDNLWARNCSLTRVNIYGKAKNVDLQQNHILELYFTQPENLESLRLKDNSLESLASLTKATNLLEFDISNNPRLKFLPDLWEVDSLERLDLSNTSLREIPASVIQSPERLKTLNVSYNRLQQIDPLQFHNYEKLQRMYIHHNDWNCYNLQLFMDMVIRPYRISYTLDEYDDNFPGEYIGGIKCMYRIQEEVAGEEEKEAQQEDELATASTQDVLNFRRLSSQLNQADAADSESNAVETSDVELFRREFKAVIGIYEQKFALVLKKLEDMDERLKKFEKFNKTMWQHVTITV